MDTRQLVDLLFVCAYAPLEEGRPDIIGMLGNAYAPRRPRALGEAAVESALAPQSRDMTAGEIAEVFEEKRVYGADMAWDGERIGGGA